MVISKMQSGLGNQMFQYASGKALAIKLNRQHICDVSSFINDKLRDFSLSDFNISSEISSKNFSWAFKSKKSIDFWRNKFLGNSIRELKDPIWKLNQDFFKIDDHKIILLTGYWALRKYFESIRSIIIEEFTLKSDLQNKLTKWCTNSTLSNSVAVHIRRGDYLQTAQAENFEVQTKNYYYNSIKWINNKLSSPVFYFFSDDIDWVVKEWFPEFSLFAHCIPVYPDPINSPALELKKMSMCQNQIIANSSFSWWAAWLNVYNDKIVIQPKIWYKNNEWQKVYEAGELNTDNGWIKI